MSSPITFIYSGQGSQYINMGKSCFTHHDVFNYWLRKADALLIELTGHSLITALYESSNNPFNDLLISHPAIVAIEISIVEMLKSEGIFPTSVWGNSIGELAAAAEAKLITKEQAIIYAINQAKTVIEHAENGGMIAIIASPEIYHTTPELSCCCLAGVNFDTHFVISGNSYNIHTAQYFLTKKNITFHKLDVNYGFHSKSIAPLVPYFTHSNYVLSTSTPSCQFISSATMSVNTFVTPTHFWNAIREPIQFQQTYKNTFDKNTFYIDVGPSGTMVTFLKYNESENQKIQCSTTITPFTKDMSWLEKLKNLIQNHHNYHESYHA